MRKRNNNNNKKAVKQLVKKMKAVKIAEKPKPFSRAGSIAGKAVGQMFGHPKLGQGIGKWLGSGIGQIFGSGDYTMSGPTPSYNVMVNSNQVPKFSTNGQTNIVCHREYLGDLNGTSSFNLASYPLNPGIDNTFPWLSTIAQNYQEYRIHGLIFEFRPLITDFVTGGQPGVVIMATNYNADAALYTSKQQMENSEYAVSVKPTLGLVHGVECATPLTILPQRFVRTGSVPTGQDLRLYDHGNFQIATQNNAITSAIGELWVSYCVEFFKPILPTTPGGDVQSGHTGRAVAASANPLGTLSLFNVGSLTLNVTATSISWNANPGNLYLVTVFWIGSTAAAVNAPALVASGGSLQSFFANDSLSNAFAPATVVSTTSCQSTVLVKCTLTNPGLMSITPTLSGVFPGTNTVDIYVTTVDNSITN